MRPGHLGDYPSKWRRFQAPGVGVIKLERWHMRSRYRHLNIFYAISVITALCWFGYHYRVIHAPGWGRAHQAFGSQRPPA
jgi:hypothetical protein